MNPTDILLIVLAVSIWIISGLIFALKILGGEEELIRGRSQAEETSDKVCDRHICGRHRCNDNSSYGVQHQVSKGALEM